MVKRIACEVCGSNELIKQDGVFICEACGCKYTLEEVRKMTIEGTVEVVGTVQVDTTKQIVEQVGKLVQLAKDAIANNDYDAATSYVEKALDLKLDDPEVWMLKLNCALREAPLDAEFDDRKIKEAEKNAIQYSPDSEKENIKHKIYDLELTRIKNRIAYLSRLLGDDMMIGFIRDYYNSRVQSNSINPSLETRMGMNLEKDEVECGKNLFACEMILHRIIIEAFPSCFELIGKADECVSQFSNYKNSLVRRADACHYRFPPEWEESWEKTKKDLRDALMRAKERSAKEKERKMEEERQRIEAYWEEHPEEKENLEAERVALQNDIDILSKEEKEVEESLKQLEIVNGNLQQKDKRFSNEIQELKTKQRMLSAFKIKEKRQLQDQIEQLESKRPSRKEIEEETSAIKQERIPQIEALKNRLKTIHDQKNEKRNEVLRIEKELELKKPNETGVYQYKILVDKCSGCTACARICPERCITGEVRKSHIINQQRCTLCGQCKDICKFDAIVTI